MSPPAAIWTCSTACWANLLSKKRGGNASSFFLTFSPKYRIIRIVQIPIYRFAQIGIIQNSKFIIQNYCVRVAHVFQSFAQQIPQLCILHFEFCISSISPNPAIERVPTAQSLRHGFAVPPPFTQGRLWYGA